MALCLFYIVSPHVWFLNEFCNDSKVQAHEDNTNAEPLTASKDMTKLVDAEQNGKKLSCGCNCRGRQGREVMNRQEDENLAQARREVELK